MIQIIDKIQLKQVPKSQKIKVKDTAEFKDTLNKAVSEQNQANQTNQTSSQRNQTQNSDNTKKEDAQNVENGVPKKEPIAEDKLVADELTLAVNAFQMGVKPEIKPLQIELPKEMGTLKVDVELVANSLEKNLSLLPEGMTENGLKDATENQLQNSSANMFTKSNDALGKIKLDNFEKETASVEPTKKSEVKSEVQEAKLDLKVNSEKTQKITENNSEDQDQTAFDTTLENEASVAELQKTVKLDEPEVIKVKVGDGQLISSEKLVTEVAKNIVIKTDGKNEYELQLDPENLGKIKVKLLFEEGKLTVSMLCNNSKTANLLSDGIVNLGQAIQQNTKSEVTVNVSEENYLNDNQNQQNKQNSSNQQQQRDGKQDETEFEDQMKLGLWEIENLRKQFSADFRIM